MPIPRLCMQLALARRVLCLYARICSRFPSVPKDNSKSAQRLETVRFLLDEGGRAKALNPDLTSIGTYRHHCAVLV